MNRFARTLATALPAAAILILAGCTAPVAVERSQRLQLEAMVQYRDEMAAYHDKVKTQLAADKRTELDSALAASLAQSADGGGRVDVATALEKVRKRLDLEEQFRASLARLDGEFLERQAAIGRAIELARGTLDLLADYSRMGTLIRSLFTREVEAREVITNYETERSPSHAGSPSEPEAGGG
jgi:multidrug efflux pump subunit AcrA (membrane-fusion protein)